jgi:hypothetical protein
MHDQTEALKAVALADDFTIIRAFEFLHGRLVDRLGLPLADLADELQNDVRLSTAARSQLAAFRENEGEELAEDQSIAAARQLLVEMTGEADSAALVVDSLAGWPDDRKSVAVVLSIGLVGVVWLLIATTRVTFRDGRIIVEKQPINIDKLELKTKEIAVVLKTRPELPTTHAHPPRIMGEDTCKSQLPR